MSSAGVEVQQCTSPQTLRIVGGAGAIAQCQDLIKVSRLYKISSAQLVSHLLDPQISDVVIDAYLQHQAKQPIAELMQSQGRFGLATKPFSSQRLSYNAQRLQLKSIQICTGDSRNYPQFTNDANRLARCPCSGIRHMPTP
jgi:16S rRNA (cytosine967-C5)-methyltransferase